MQKIIALYASANKGKSTTLNKLIDLLETVADNFEISRAKESMGYFEVWGKKIVVCTPGDTQEIIKGNIKFTQKHECDIFITATRTKGGTTEEIEKLTDKNSAQLVWVSKEDDESKNSLIAAELFSLIIKDIDPIFGEFVFNVKE